MPTSDWADLSDAELRARLVWRGVPIEVARSVVAQRDDEDMADKITLALAAG